MIFDYFTGVLKVNKIQYSEYVIFSQKDLKQRFCVIQLNINCRKVSP